MLGKTTLSGGQTAAITKAIYHTHVDPRYKSGAFLAGAPKSISEQDKLYLPVDQVISNIFEKSFGMLNPDFRNINDLISETYFGDQVEVWDDLWFWGFITQKGSVGIADYSNG